ncbi:MAG TPA: type II secretion system F family protein [Oscillospiraceae bacterium]|nr:type II secretion system F family protein [Oscillospiraceae bacterium]
MPLYAYQVLDRRGAVASGKLEAENEFSAAARLKKLGYTPLEVNEAKTSAFKQMFQFKKKVTTGDLAMFSRQLASMLNAGIPLTRCLYALGEQAANQTLGETLLDVANNVEGGMSFSASLRAYPGVFNDIYVDLISAGELGGTLETVLERLAQQLESEKLLKDNVRSAMLYPSVVLCFAVLVMIAMLLFIVPVFLGFYPPDADIPALTSLIIGVSNSMRGYWYLYLVFFAVLMLGVRTYVLSEAGKKTYDRLKFRIPIFGSLIQKTVIARFARTLSTLLAGGIPVLQALDSAGPAAGSSLIEEAVRVAGERIQEGQSIAAPLKESGLFPPMVTLMISVGEETGDLPGLLVRVSDFYEAEVATMSKGLTSMIEPLMIIGVGGLIGFMVIALYLPMFSVITQIG